MVNFETKSHESMGWKGRNNWLEVYIQGAVRETWLYFSFLITWVPCDFVQRTNYAGDCTKIISSFFTALPGVKLTATLMKKYEDCEVICLSPIIFKFSSLFWFLLLLSFPKLWLLHSAEFEGEFPCRNRRYSVNIVNIEYETIVVKRENLVRFAAANCTFQ